MPQMAPMNWIILFFFFFFCFILLNILNYFMIDYSCGKIAVKVEENGRILHSLNWKW